MIESLNRRAGWCFCGVLNVIQGDRAIVQERRKRNISWWKKVKDSLCIHERREFSRPWERRWEREGERENVKNVNLKWSSWDKERAKSFRERERENDWYWRLHINPIFTRLNHVHSGVDGTILDKKYQKWKQIELSFKGRKIKYK